MPIPSVATHPANTTWRAITIALLCVASLGGCKTQPGIFEKTSSQGPVLHRESGFSFPLTVAGLLRENAVQYDHDGRDISMEYDDTAIPLAGTVYVYPTRGRTLSAEFAGVQAQIGLSHPGARLLEAGSTAVTPRQYNALSASYAYEGSFGGVTQPLRSQMVVGQLGERFVEYRFTYPAYAQSAAAERIAAFVRAFAWP